MLGYVAVCAAFAHPRRVLVMDRRRSAAPLPERPGRYLAYSELLPTHLFVTGVGDRAFHAEPQDAVERVVAVVGVQGRQHEVTRQGV